MISSLCLADKDEANIRDRRDLCFASDSGLMVGRGVDRVAIELAQRWTNAWRKPSILGGKCHAIYYNDF
jgi:hypothetical protein